MVKGRLQPPPFFSPTLVACACRCYAATMHPAHRLLSDTPRLVTRHRPAQARDGDDDTDGPSPGWRRLFDLDLIERVLHDAARNGRALSYAETLDALGYGFSRPKMRALCAALHTVDERAQGRGQPPLAVLVVRASDGLPGAGWWVDKDRNRYQGPREGVEATAYIRRKQRLAFAYWKNK